MTVSSHVFAFLQDAKIPYTLNEPLKNHTTFKIGGPAAVFAQPQSESSLSQLFSYCSENGVDVLVLGNGSNMLIKDSGFDGVVISMGDPFSKIELVDEETVFCGAGAKLSQLCVFAMKNGLSGLEFAYGIPGSVGGAAFMNAGAYGGEMKDVTDRCTHIDAFGKTGSFSGADLQFGYRESVYSDGGYIITGVQLKLKKDDPGEIKKRMDDFMARRRDKQPLEYPSAGSVFKRPEGYFAGALIQQCGLKGTSVGGAQVSEKHAGFIINRGGATCEDVKALVSHVQNTVLSETGVKLECEIKFI